MVMKSNSKKSLFQFAFAALALSFTTLSLNSCNRNCGGGGWYGDRNLTDVKIEKPVTSKPLTTDSAIICEETKPTE